MANYPTDGAGDRPYYFPRIGRFYLSPEVADEMGFDRRSKPTAIGIRWFNWTMAITDTAPEQQNETRQAEFARAVNEAKRPKAEPEVKRRK